MVSVRAVTIEKVGKKTALSYVNQRAIIDTHATGMLNHEAFALMDISKPEVRWHVSLLLQIIATY